MLRGLAWTQDVEGLDQCVAVVRELSAGIVKVTVDVKRNGFVDIVLDNLNR